MASIPNGILLAIVVSVVFGILRFVTGLTLRLAILAGIVIFLYGLYQSGYLDALLTLGSFIV